jgi:hypothetical protein
VDYYFGLRGRGICTDEEGFNMLEQQNQHTISEVKVTRNHIKYRPVIFIASPVYFRGILHKRKEEKLGKVMIGMLYWPEGVSI